MKVLILGATGSAGGSVLKACLATREVREVRSITRRPLAMEDPGLRSALHADFTSYDGLEEFFTGLSACFYCLGVSATQVSDEDKYRRVTVDFAVAAATALGDGSPAAAFHFVSGVGTGPDSRFMWARVKAEAEEQVMDVAGAVCWRPGFIDGEASSTGAWYHGVLRPAFRLLKPMRSLYVSGEDLGLAMLQATRERMKRRVIVNREIRELAERWRAGEAPGPESGTGRS
jgi:uncharacterized protein YbjT (DUF2867 family)